MLRRIATLPRAASLYGEIERARRSEARALARAGEVACGIAEVRGSAEIAHALGEASTLRERREAAGRAAAASLDQDRADWAGASSWLKVLIAVRGVLVRAVLRAQQRRVERDLAPILTVIGAHAAVNPSLAALLPEHVTADVQQQRARAERAAAARAQLLTAFGGRALPPSVDNGLRELLRVMVGLGNELRSRLLPRLPGLAGLAAGWWVAQSFTASRWAALTDRLGIRRGGAWVVSAETYERLEFWVPLGAAALCGYLGSQLWAALERRYTVAAAERDTEHVRHGPPPRTR